MFIRSFASLRLFNSVVEFFRSMAWRVFMCACVCFTLIQSIVAANESHKNETNDSGVQDSPKIITGTSSHDKTKGLFSRTRHQGQKRLTQKPRPESTGQIRRCARLKEGCSAQIPCCNPCAFCHCRLFNTICQCWRSGVCLKKT